MGIPINTNGIPAAFEYYSSQWRTNQTFDRGGMVTWRPHADFEAAAMGGASMWEGISGVPNRSNRYAVTEQTERLIRAFSCPPPHNPHLMLWRSQKLGELMFYFAETLLGKLKIWGTCDRPLLTRRWIRFEILLRCCLVKFDRLPLGNRIFGFGIWGL